MSNTVTQRAARGHLVPRLGVCAVLLALFAPSIALAATSPTATWKVSSLKANSTYAVSALFSTNSTGSQTWTASQKCSVKGTTVTTGPSGACVLKVSIKAAGKLAARTATKTFTLTGVTPTTTTTVARTTTTVARTTTTVPRTTTTVPQTTTTIARTTTTTTSTSTTTTTVPGVTCPTSNFPDLSSVPGAGGSYTKPSVSVSCSNGFLNVDSNGMIGYTFVKTTPNDIGVQDYKWKVTLSPSIAGASTTIKNVLGTLGFTVTGIPIYGPTESEVDNYGDPVFNNLLDSCKGHPGGMKQYHYHAILAINDCYLNRTVIGYANDGFPIYSNPSYTYKSGYAKTGNPRTNAWDAYTYSAGDANTLDACNGRTDSSGNYGYYITEAFPYILGCYKGTPGNQVGKAAAPMVMGTNVFICRIRGSR